MKKSFAIMVALGLLCSCGGERVTIEGEFAACPNQSVMLEGVGANGTIEGDTLATTNNNGQFRLRISLPNNESSFYNLRCAERTIPLILSKGERVVVNSVPGLIDGYTVSGSKESELVREVKNIMRFGVAKLDSLATIYEKTSAKALQKTINDEYKKVYLDIKRSQLSSL